MKNIFGCNIKSANGQVDGFETFKIKDVDPELSKKADNQYDELTKYKKKSSLPMYLSVIYYISLIGALILTGGIISALGDVSFKDAINNAKAVFIIAIVLWIIYIVLLVVKSIKYKKVVNSEEVKTSIDNSEIIYNECINDLNIPFDSPKVDVFLYPYKLKNGKEVQVTPYAKYYAQEVRLFKDGNNLCMGDISSVIAIRIDSFKKIEKINKRVMFMQWNKDEAYNKGKYKDYKIALNNYGSLIVKTYYRFLIEQDYKEYEFFIPPYELDIFLQYIDLPVEDLKD